MFRGPLRTERRRRAVFAEATDQDAAGLRAQAVQLAEAADWDAAVLALFRALVRSLSERGIIAEFPGMTAREASSRAAERLPDLAERLTRAATVFDSVAYGHNPGSAEQYRDLLALDAPWPPRVRSPSRGQWRPRWRAGEALADRRRGGGRPVRRAAHGDRVAARAVRTPGGLDHQSASGGRPSAGPGARRQWSHRHPGHHPGRGDRSRGRQHAGDLPEPGVVDRRPDAAEPRGRRPS